MKLLALLTLSFVVLLGCGKSSSSITGPSPTPEAQNKDMKYITCNVPTPQKSDPTDVDIEFIRAQLKGEGLGGWIHAAVRDQYMFVFTWRDPNNFFVNIQLPVSSKDSQVLAALGHLRRHDQVLVKGDYYNNKAPLPHIEVTSLEIVNKYNGPVSDYVYESFPDEILSSNRLIGEVHIVTQNGSVLVIEYKDRVFPVFVPNPEVTRKLYRGDKIEIDYVATMQSNRPTHLTLVGKQPIRLIEQIACGHNKPLELTGELVMFPQSPQILFNVFALSIADAEDVQREYTLVNFTDMDLFTALRERLQKAWDENLDSVLMDRNKFINPKIRITARGIKNVVSADQANPQILINNLDDLSIEILP